MHSQTLLRQIASEQWKAGTVKEVILDWNGDCFQFVLDYLQEDGHVVFPIIFCKSLFLAELVFFGINNVDESKIVYDYHFLSTHSHVLMVSEIKSWEKPWCNCFSV